jgi:hypothetical protein
MCAAVAWSRVNVQSVTSVAVWRVAVQLHAYFAWLCFAVQHICQLLCCVLLRRSLYMSWAQASLSQTLQSQVLDVFLGDYAEEATRVEVRCKHSQALLLSFRVLLPCLLYLRLLHARRCF